MAANQQPEGSSIHPGGRGRRIPPENTPQQLLGLYYREFHVPNLRRVLILAGNPRDSKRALRSDLNSTLRPLSAMDRQRLEETARGQYEQTIMRRIHRDRAEPAHLEIPTMSNSSNKGFFFFFWM